MRSDNTNKRRSPRSQQAEAIPETVRNNEETQLEHENQLNGDTNPSDQDSMEGGGKKQKLQNEEMQVVAGFENSKFDVFGNETDDHSLHHSDLSGYTLTQDKLGLNNNPLVENTYDTAVSSLTDMGRPLNDSTSIKQSDENKLQPLQQAERLNGSVEELLKGWLQEGKELQETWIPSFSASERFEQFCPTRIDIVLEQARELESHLRKQKELLRQKLVALSSTLQSA